MKNNLVIAYGSGGHAAQAKRLEKYLIENNLTEKDKIYYILESDVNGEHDSSNTLLVSSLRHKYSKISSFFMIFKIPFSIFKISRFIVVNNISVVISPGPGCAIISAVSCKITRKKFIFIESWSRFTTLSFSGKICKLLADDFYVQNKSLLRMNKFAKYVGKL